MIHHPVTTSFFLRAVTVRERGELPPNKAPAPLRSRLVMSISLLLMALLLRLRRGQRKPAYGSYPVVRGSVFAIAKYPTIETFCAEPAETGIPTRKDVDELSKEKEKYQALLELAAPEMSAIASIRGSGSPSLGRGFDQSSVLVGLTDFMLQRAETELRTWAMDTFLKDLCKEGRKGKVKGGDLLPETCVMLKDSEYVLLSSGGLLLLVDALRKDLRGAPVRAADKIIAGGKLSGAKLDMVMLLGVSARIAQGVMEGEDPWLMIDAWGSQQDMETVSCNKTPATALSHFAAVLLATFPVDANGGLLVPKKAEDLKYAVLAAIVNKQSVAAKDWPAGCLAVAVGNGTDKKVDFTNLIKNLQSFSDQFGEVSKKFEDLATAVKAARKAEDKDKLKAMAKVVAAALKLTGEALPLARQMLPMLEVPEPCVVAGKDGECKDSDIEGLLDEVADGLVAAAEADWSRVFFHAVEILRTVTNKKSVTKALPKNLLRVLSFATQMAQSDNVDSARAAMEAFAAPPGGYKGKRSGDVHVTLNSYVGAIVGGEYLADGAADGELGGHLAPLGMLGVEFGGKCSECSCGLFVSLLDVGQIMAWRIKGQEKNDPEDDKTEVDPLPSFNIKQVFAPGLFFVLGLGDTPFSLGLGGTYSPWMRTYTEVVEEPETEASTGHAVFRAGVFFAMDLVLFP